ncbi:hypothetical protein [Streptomyces canarius]
MLSISSSLGLSGSGAPLMLSASSTNLRKNASRAVSWTWLNASPSSWVIFDRWATFSLISAWRLFVSATWSRNFTGR